MGFWALRLPSAVKVYVMLAVTMGIPELAGLKILFSDTGMDETWAVPMNNPVKTSTTAATIRK
jgi:hypothetical protein